jgi:hypothetical protein
MQEARDCFTPFFSPNVAEPKKRDGAHLFRLTGRGAARTVHLPIEEMNVDNQRLYDIAVAQEGAAIALRLQREEAAQLPFWWVEHARPAAQRFAAEWMAARRAHFHHLDMDVTPGAVPDPEQTEIIAEIIERAIAEHLCGQAQNALAKVVVW